MEGLHSDGFAGEFFYHKLQVVMNGVLMFCKGNFIILHYIICNPSDWSKTVG